MSKMRTSSYPSASPSKYPGLPLPYGFHPVEPDQAILDTPVWRDGSAEEKTLSGELLLGFKALTPLFVGNHQEKIDEKHARIYPQMLSDGRVLISATTLKGMLRSALVRLLHAPMEKVAEHHYTYRPNLGFGPPQNPRREVRAAIVDTVEDSEEKANVTIRLLSKNATVVFVRREAEKQLGEKRPGTFIRGSIKGVKLEGDSHRQRLVPSNGQQELDHLLLDYVGGIDGEGLMAKAFRQNKDIYRKVLVPRDAVEKSKRISLPEKVYRAYYQTQKILADEHIGHLAPGHPLKKKLSGGDVRRAILENARLRPNQLVYVEIEHGKTPEGKDGIRITSLGHHFHYRWAYTSSVRYLGRLLDGVGKIRPELARHPEETCDENGKPRKLTAGRLLFGYALSDSDVESNDIAKGTYTRLAGRIAFNHAVEVCEDPGNTARFLEKGQEIQLKVLGMPRPSAVEFYIRQEHLHENPPRLTTYGDLPDDTGGKLAGRKYYRHQPKAGKDRNVFASEQNDANRLCFVSPPGSQFRCTLRFESLRPWELGALLAALEPDRLAGQFDITSSHGYAHKLGYGKPLGLGSLRFTIDGARWRYNENWEWHEARGKETEAFFKEALDAFTRKIRSQWGDKTLEHVDMWLKPLAWSNVGEAAYPTAEKNGDIYQFHTQLRRAHAAARRGGNDRDNIMKKLKTLLEI